MKVRKAARIRNRYNQVLHLILDTKWESDKNTIKHHRSALSEQVQWADAKAWQAQDIKNINDPQKKYRLRTVSKNILLEGLNQLHCTSLNCIIYTHHSFFFCIFYLFLSLSFSFPIFFYFLLLFLPFSVVLSLLTILFILALYLISMDMLLCFDIFKQFCYITKCFVNTCKNTIMPN